MLPASASDVACNRSRNSRQTRFANRSAVEHAARSDTAQSRMDVLSRKTGEAGRFPDLSPAGNSAPAIPMRTVFPSRSRFLHALDSSISHSVPPNSRWRARRGERLTPHRGFRGPKNWRCLVAAFPICFGTHFSLFGKFAILSIPACRGWAAPLGVRRPLAPTSQSLPCFAWVSSISIRPT